MKYLKKAWDLLGKYDIFFFGFTAGMGVGMWEISGNLNYLWALGVVPMALSRLHTLHQRIEGRDSVISHLQGIAYGTPPEDENADA